MTYAETILPEFDQEMASTRKVLERIPEDKFGWRAHPKSNTLGWNANHLVEIAGWFEGTLTMDAWDVAPPGGEPYKSPNLGSRRELVQQFDEWVAAGRRALASVKDEAMSQPWSLMKGGQPIITMPRSAIVRTLLLNHMIHHRAIVTVYLRLNDIPVPGLYGPSGDERTPLSDLSQ